MRSCAALFCVVLVKNLCSADVSISAGSQHNCALESVKKKSGPLASQIKCWGSPPHGQLSRVPNGDEFVQVSSSISHSCALRVNGSISCWGFGGLALSPNAEGNFIQVTVGGFHSCGLRSDGSVYCFGKNSHGQLNVPILPEGVKFSQLSAGKTNTCGLRDDGRIECFGSNLNGESSPVQASPNDRFVQISCGIGSHCCALRKGSNTAYCWGNNMFSQTDSPPDVSFYQITTGERFSCGIVRPPTSDDADSVATNALLCWGVLQGGPPQLGKEFSSLDEISAGKRHVCAVARRTHRDANPAIICFGSRAHGVLDPPSA
jgi:alpha-tubulin suppressor-like RCC1 family protein